MKKIFYIYYFMILPFGSVKAACSGSDCCTISSGVVTAPDNNACAIQPSTYGITLYDKYLCTSPNNRPTTSSPMLIYALMCFGFQNWRISCKNYMYI